MSLARGSSARKLLSFLLATLFAAACSRSVKLEEITVRRDAPEAAEPWQAVSLSAWARYSDGRTEEVTGRVRWASSAPAVVAVTGAGQAVALAPGESSITAIDPGSGRSGRAVVAVAPPPGDTLESLSVFPPAAVVRPGQSVDFLALGRYASGVTVDLSDHVTWHSGTPLVASVTASGRADAGATGSTTVLAWLVAADPPADVVASEPLTVGAYVEPGLPVVDWLSAAVAFQGGGTEERNVFERGTAGATRPEVSVRYVETTPPFPGLRLVASLDLEESLSIALRGVAPGSYDVATGASVRAAKDGAVLRAGPDVPGSSGSVFVTRAGAAGETVQGFLDLEACAHAGDVLLACGFRITGAFSATREGDVRWQDEGAPASPVPLTTEVPRASGVATGASYYAAVGLQPGTGYFVTLFEVVDDVVLDVFAGDGFGGSPACSTTISTATGTVGSCGVLLGPSQSSLSVRVTHAGAGAGASFRVLVSASPYVAEGTAADPLPLGAIPLQHSGVVDQGASHYVVDVPGPATVSLSLTPDGDDGGTAPVLGVFTDPSFTTPFCAPHPHSGGRTSCGGTTSAPGVLYVRVTAPGRIGCFFGLSGVVRTAEGTAENAVTLASNAPHAGEVDTGLSYYRIATKPGRTYVVDLTWPSDDVTLTVRTAPGAAPLCTSATAGDADEHCEVAAPGDVLLLVVDGSSTDGGARYDLAVVPRYVSVGSAASPVPLAVGALLDAEVADGETSYFSAALSPVKDHTVILRQDSPVLSLHASSDAAMTELVCEYTPYAPSQMVACLLPSGTYRSVYLQVSGAGADFRVGVVEGLLVGEEYALSNGETHYGTVDGDVSRFNAFPEAGQSATVTLSQASDDVDLEVWLLSGRGPELVCASATAGSGDEQCAVAGGGVTPGAYLEIRVSGANTLGGAGFLVRFEASWAPEGMPAAPVTVAVGEPRGGAVDGTASYYQAAATPGETYGVRVRNPTADVALRVYGDASFAGVPLCTSSTAGDEVCYAAATGTTLYVLVDGAGLATGAQYELEVVPPGEGAPGSPVALTLGASRASFVGAGSSYYEVAVSAGTRYAIEASASGLDATLRVFGDATFSGEAICVSAAVDPNGRFCVVEATGTALGITVGGAGEPAQLDLLARPLVFGEQPQWAKWWVVDGPSLFLAVPDVDPLMAYAVSVWFLDGSPGQPFVVSADPIFATLAPEAASCADDWCGLTYDPSGTEFYLRIPTFAVVAGTEVGVEVYGYVPGP